MNEEEIIQKIQEWIISMRKGTRVSIIHKGDVDFCNYLDDLLELYQKEKEKNERLIYRTIKYDNTLEHLQRDTIRKDKIREKIKELEKAYEDSKDENGESQYYYPNYAIDILESLLEEE